MPIGHRRTTVTDAVKLASCVCMLRRPASTRRPVLAIIHIHIHIAPGPLVTRFVCSLKGTNNRARTAADCTSLSLGPSASFQRRGLRYAGCSSKPLRPLDYSHAFDLVGSSSGLRTRPLFFFFLYSTLAPPWSSLSAAFVPPSHRDLILLLRDNVTVLLLPTKPHRTATTDLRPT
ncbi:hypothetical protein CC78DRAFT_579559 [Lojkania enalia]|uniref:Uncharacterized protein n=1 Tax=Lojkania enalia TaxID=147567 RepID=A0A9P4N4S9_9PLEO|nr:hypothetical protein CC78DRAFT_579559 [Didymosphaeria enalia]